MYDKLLHDQLEVTRRLLQAVEDLPRLHDALQAMAVLIDADAATLSVGGASGSTQAFFSARTHTAPADTDHTVSVLAPFRTAALRRAPRELYRLSDLLPLSALQQNPFYRRMLTRSAPLVDGCAGYIPLHNGACCTLAFAQFQRDQPSALNGAGLAAMNALLPHVQRVLDNHLRLESLRAVSSAAMHRFDRYHVGVVVVNEEGLMVYANAAAEALFRDTDGLRLRQGYIDVSVPAEAETLMREIRERIEGRAPEPAGGPHVLQLSRGEGRAPLSLAVSSYRSVVGAPGRGHAVLMIHDPEQRQTELSTLIASVHGLSERESELTCALAEGESLETFADRSGRTLDSVRSQLKRIYKKTGTARQTELVRLVLAGPASIVV